SRRNIKRYMIWCFFFYLIISLCVPAAGQDRMPKIPTGKLTEAQKKALDEYRAAKEARAEACRDPRMDRSKCSAAYFDIHGPMVPLLRSPEVMITAADMGPYLEFKTVLPPMLRELVILITARHWTQQYVWNSHYTSALKTGIAPGVVKAVAEGRRPADMPNDEDIVYEFCDELNRNHSVSDTTYARALAKFGEQGIIDMVSVDGYYTFLSMVMNVARTPLPTGASAPALVPLPR
ncbi:MAG: carboxymuconolactone decarboxylase family protein, partial [Terriglobia bacterium]